MVNCQGSGRGPACRGSRFEHRDVASRIVWPGTVPVLVAAPTASQAKAIPSQRVVLCLCLHNAFLSFSGYIVLLQTVMAMGWPWPRPPPLPRAASPQTTH